MADMLGLSLMTSLQALGLALLAGIMGAVTMRFGRDARLQEWTGRGIGTGRLLYALPLGGLFLLMGVQPLLAGAVTVALYAGSTLPMRGMDMGRGEGTWTEDALWMLGRGLAVTGILATPLCWQFGPSGLLVLPLGILHPVVYEVGWRLRWRPTEVGEAAWGGVIAGVVTGVLA